MKRLYKIFLFSIIFLALPLSVSAQGKNANLAEKRYEGIVSSVKESKLITTDGPKRIYQKLEVQITNKNLKGKIIIIENGKVPVINSVEYGLGDKVVISATRNSEGKEVFFITDYVRRDSIYILFGIFVAVTILIGGVRGLASLFGMVISFLVIFFIVLPLILSGQDPILVAILSSLFIIPVNFYLSHGFNKKTTIAVAGTIFALILTGVLANLFVNISHLSGFSSEDATFLETAKKGVIQMKGLLLAGIIIGALGVLDDITISQAAIVFQLKDTSQKLGIWALFSKAMDIGRDHIASMVNTLVLVYTGASLPLLLLFVNTPLPFSEVISYELIAEEIVRTLVVSIGLILAVPIVTFLSAVACNLELKRAAKEILHSLK
ncbi:MAG TPA: YibE/F family protein [Candidatus Limnocylindrales bacterium]|nr:YibE/F family protein [Candidatus Limnocylindrales bacterium]